MPWSWTILRQVRVRLAISGTNTLALGNMLSAYSPYLTVARKAYCCEFDLISYSRYRPTCTRRFIGCITDTEPAIGTVNCRSDKLEFVKGCVQLFRVHCIQHLIASIDATQPIKPRTILLYKIIWIKNVVVNYVMSVTKPRASSTS
jgi:hypothetical protein